LKELQAMVILMVEQVHLEINLQEEKPINKFIQKLNQDIAKHMNSHREKWKQFQAILDLMIG
jgi:hypothetical protein